MFVFRFNLRSFYVLIFVELFVKCYRVYVVWKKKIFVNEFIVLVVDVLGFKYLFVFLFLWIVWRFILLSWVIWNFLSVEVGKNIDFSFVFFKYYGGNDNVFFFDWGFVLCLR